MLFPVPYIILTHLSLGRKFPLAVNLSLTNKCNFNCKYCSIPKMNRKEMNLQQILNLISEFAKMGTQRLGLTGGEALLRTDIGKIIKYAKRKGIFTTLITNGWFIEQKIDEIRNLDVLIVSFDGPKQVHDKLKRKGSYGKVMKGIRMAREEGIQVWSITVLTKLNTNLKCIEFILSKAKELDFLTYYQPLILNAPAISGKIEQLLPSYYQHKKIFKKLLKEKIKGAPILQSTKCLMYLFNWPDYRRTCWENGWPTGIKKGKCWAGRLFCSITCDGYVYPCLVKIGKVPALNWMKSGFKVTFDNLSKYVSRDCWCHVNIEYNNIFSLEANVLLDLMKMIK